MATPTPSSASKRPAGSGSTPSHLNQSSPPRSVPSPITARHAAGKTPVNHPTTSSSQGSKTIGSTPMVQNLSQTGNTSSPSANMLSFNTPSGLGIDGTTPAGLNMSTPALGGAPMMPSMSDLGLTTSGGKRNEDEERRAKMRKVLKSIGKPKGRVSEEGIARVSRRVGFANDIDAEKLTPEEKERKVGNRTIQTAGNFIMIEVSLRHQVPQNVLVTYNTQSKALEELGERTGKVLFDDLKPGEEVGLNAKLDRFAANLERLAKLDRLSPLNGVNCFEALSGMYSSLKRLYEQEKESLTAAGIDGERQADIEVMCKKSGKPILHDRNRLGLEIAYWHDSRLIRGRSENIAATTPMEVDGQQTNTDTTTTTEDSEQIFSLRIEAEASPAALYPALRVSETWLPDPLQLPSTDSEEGIPWQDPPPTFLAANAGGNEMSVDGQQKLPDLRFVAKLDPPLVMPYQTAMNVLTSVNAPQPAMMMIPQQYAALLLDPAKATDGQSSTASFTMNAVRDVLSMRDGQETTVQHDYVLDNVKLDWGFQISELPFSHPRQLVELLPTLRQWACVGSLLKATFNSQSPQNSSVKGKADTNGTANGATNGATNGTTNGHFALHDLLDQPPLGQKKDNTAVNIALATAPTPTLSLMFPTTDSERLASISVQVLPNADMAISSHEGIVSQDASNTDEKMQKLAKALDVCADPGLWVEWLRTTQVSSTS